MSLFRDVKDCLVLWDANDFTRLIISTNPECSIRCYERAEWLVLHSLKHFDESAPVLNPIKPSAVDGKANIFTVRPVVCVFQSPKDVHECLHLIRHCWFLYVLYYNL